MWMRLAMSAGPLRASIPKAGFYSLLSGGYDCPDLERLDQTKVLIGMGK